MARQTNLKRNNIKATWILNLTTIISYILKSSLKTQADDIFIFGINPFTSSSSDLGLVIFSLPTILVGDENKEKYQQGDYCLS